MSRDPRSRCPWCGDDPLYVAYHDTEWGVPVHDDRTLFEALVLDGAPRNLDLLRPELLVALPTFAFAWWMRSLGGTVVVGMLLFWLAGKADPLWFTWLR